MASVNVISPSGYAAIGRRRGHHRNRILDDMARMPAGLFQDDNDDNIALMALLAQMQGQNQRFAIDRERTANEKVNSAALIQMQKTLAQTQKMLAEGTVGNEADRIRMSKELAVVRRDADELVATIRKESEAARNASAEEIARGHKDVALASNKVQEGLLGVTKGQQKFLEKNTEIQGNMVSMARLVASTAARHALFVGKETRKAQGSERKLEREYSDGTKRAVPLSGGLERAIRRGKPEDVAKHLGRISKDVSTIFKSGKSAPYIQGKLDAYLGVIAGVELSADEWDISDTRREEIFSNYDKLVSKIQSAGEGLFDREGAFADLATQSENRIDTNFLDSQAELDRIHPGVFKSSEDFQDLLSGQTRAPGIDLEGAIDDPFSGDDSVFNFDVGIEDNFGDVRGPMTVSQNLMDTLTPQNPAIPQTLMQGFLGPAMAPQGFNAGTPGIEDANAPQQLRDIRSEVQGLMGQLQTGMEEEELRGSAQSNMFMENEKLRRIERMKAEGATEEDILRSILNFEHMAPSFQSLGMKQ